MKKSDIVRFTGEAALLAAVARGSWWALVLILVLQTIAIELLTTLLVKAQAEIRAQVGQL